MKTFVPAWRRRRLAAALFIAAPIVAVTGYLEAQAAGEFMPQVTIIELMDSMVMPSAQVVWDAVAYDVTANGETITGPKTDEDWQKLRWSAITLAESANNLAVPGRHANLAGAVAGDGELDPAQIEALIAANRGAWVGHAHVLYEAAMQAVKAIDAKDPAQVSDAGGVIDTACEGCHLQFWYPEQQR
jgi:hypothetical protein